MSFLLALLDQLAGYDGATMELLSGVRWAPLTAVLVVASAWWVKWPVTTSSWTQPIASARRSPSRA